MRPLLLGLLWGVLLGLPAAGAEVTPLPLAGDNAPAVVLWTAEHSLPDGPLADPRLDQPVRFWRAGLSMEEVADGIQQQTGVEVRFWPPEDQNRRVRVNLYLNPKTPPALRDLLAQLAWVLGCNFAVTESMPRAYYVLATAVGRDVLQQMQREEQARGEAFRQSQEEGKVALGARLEEYRGLTSLSREAVIAGYLDRDRRLTYDLIEPRRRAGTLFLLSLSPGETTALLSSGVLQKAAAGLTSEQQTLAARAIAVEAIPADALVLLRAHGAHGVQLSVRVPRPDAAEGEEYLGQGLGGLAAQPDGQYPRSQTQDISLRRLLGEVVSQEEEDGLLRAETERREAELEPVGRPEVGRDQWLAEPQLSPAGRAELERATLVWEPEHEYALWQVQEAVAALTGRQLVSDCFFQPRQRLDPDLLEALDPSFHADEESRRARLAKWMERYGGGIDFERAAPEVRQEHDALSRSSARPVALLYLLLVLCEHSERQPPEQALSSPWGWEWGDGGDFLRFRTVYPDLMRGALLPAETLARIEQLASPVVVDLRPEASAEVIRPLDEVQARLGPRLIYEDPATPVGAARTQVRNALADAFDRAAPLFHLLATLSPKQWRRLCTTGLNCEHDLTSDQQTSPAVQAQLMNGRILTGRTVTLAGVVLKLGPLVPGGEGAVPGTESLHVEFEGRDSRLSWDLGRQIQGPAASPLPHLVTIPE